MFRSSREVWLTVGLLLAVTGCSKRGPAVATPIATHVLHVSQRNEPGDLDPAHVTLPDEFFVIRALSEGLLTPNPSGGEPLPAAAERYEISADRLTYTFHLRDARWSDGEPVTADDFVASYRRVLTPGTASPKANVFFPVKHARDFLRGAITDFYAVGFRATDAHTLVVTLAQPNPRFLFYVASGPWIPTNPRVVEKFGRAWTRPENFVGNGPYVLAEWRPQQRIVVRKNPAYHDTAAVLLDEIQFLRFDDGDSEERSFRTGQVDVTMDVPRTKLAVYAKDHPDELHSIGLAETRFLTFNTQRSSLTDARVRRALSLTIDRQRIVEHVTLGGQQPAVRLVPPALAIAEANQKAQAGDSTEARQLLAAAGFPDGKNFPKLELSAWSQSQVPVLEAIQQMWKQELGIEVGIVVRDVKVHVAALMAGNYDIGFITAIPDVADAADLLNRFAASAPENYPHWTDTAYDQALAVGDYAAAESRLLESAAIAPLYFNSHHWLQSPHVNGWREDALWTRYYTSVSIDR